MDSKDTAMHEWEIPGRLNVFTEYSLGFGDAVVLTPTDLI